MFYVSKTIEVAMAHQLDLDYPSKCCEVHGHNALITVFCRAEELAENGNVTDYSKIKEIVCDLLDHKYVNDEVDFNPTAENLAEWICDQVPNCYKVIFRESERNMAAYTVDDDDVPF